MKVISNKPNQKNKSKTKPKAKPKTKSKIKPKTDIKSIKNDLEGRLNNHNATKRAPPVW